MLRRCSAALCAEAVAQPRPRSLHPPPPSPGPPPEPEPGPGGGGVLASQPQAVADAAAAVADKARGVADRVRAGRDAVEAYQDMMNDRTLRRYEASVTADGLVEWYKQTRREPPDQRTLIRIKDWNSAVTEYTTADGGKLVEARWAFFNVVYMILLLTLILQLKNWGHQRYFVDHFDYMEDELDYDSKPTDENAREEELLKRYGWYHAWMEALCDKKEVDARVKMSMYEAHHREQLGEATSSFYHGNFDKQMRGTWLRNQLGL
eukprot:TRINITY_DN24181_c0_g1_i1.p1 TRINITY_DN24181_c0_g1~~TRINITY_DN24181_c0_g1_i1.p1  ORF type:complete len:285 (+),score=107.79 TRINITY_DN24181_c0_g1_i1:67-855(+)